MKTKKVKLKVNDVVEVISGDFEGDKGTIMQLGALVAFVRLSSNGEYEKIPLKDLEFLNRP